MALNAKSRPPVKQCSTAGKAPFPLSSCRIRAMSASQSRAWMTSGKPVSRAAAICWRKPWACGLARRVVVVIVEAGLADRHDLRIFRQRDQRLGVDVQFLVSIVRMGADRTEDLRKCFSDRKHLREFAHAGADGHHAADAGGARARHHSVELAGEIREIQVAVAIDEHL